MCIEEEEEEQEEEEEEEEGGGRRRRRRRYFEMRLGLALLCSLAIRGFGRQSIVSTPMGPLSRTFWREMV